MNPLRCPGMISRRTFLRAGMLSIGGIELSTVLAGRARGERAARDTAVILLYLHGGPSHLETYDLKPEAPSGYRSVFAPIDTNVPGLRICEHLPLHAKIADKFTLVRSMHHDVDIHSDGGIIVLTGKRPTVLDPTSQSKSEHPDFGSVASHDRGLGKDGVPPYVAIPSRLYMTRPTYLGQHHAGLATGDPSSAGFRPGYLGLPADHDLKVFNNRRELLAHLDHFRRGNERAAEPIDRFREQAFSILTSSKTAQAFRLDAEPDGLRDRYGRHLWGQGCLLARRLAEAGTAVITLYIDTPQSGPEFTNWDDHIANAGRPGHFGEFMKRRLAYYDQALTALIEDLVARGSDRRVLVVAMGEFGRTPRVKENATGVGRDHWPQAYSALVAGGGLRMGQVVGATNGKGEYPTERPYSPQDLLATIYRHLGIDWHEPLADPLGRPTLVLQEGEPIRELIG